MTHSPYLHELNRLAAVLSAIQVMGTYGFYTLGFAGWADRISGDEEDGFPHTPGGNDGGGSGVFSAFQVMGTYKFYKMKIFLR